MALAPDPTGVDGPDAATWLRQAALLQSRQDLIGADLALSRARALAPRDPRIAFLHAQTRYELGYPAAALFGDALRLDPHNRDALRNRALAEASEGQLDKALASLTAALRQRPDWLDGLRVSASLRWTGGDDSQFDQDWARAARAQPKSAALWLGWFGSLAQIRDWPRAAAVLDEAQQHLGETFGLLSARVFASGESGALDQCAALLARLSGQEDQFLQVARIRLALRRGEPAIACDVALALLCGPGARQAWSYLSTAWRMLDDPRAEWLEGDPSFVRAHDVALTATELAELADVLRALHKAQLPYAEQSVRAGTQSDRSVLLRHEPILQRAKSALLDAVRSHIAGLPPHDARHPLLSQPRGEQKFSGSWSVRLGPGGFNVTHSHPMGWLSSAFYVACDDQTTLGEPPAGHFHWGAPPDDLGIDLPPRGTIAPSVGTLVLFPSYVWHGTVPIVAGERLNIAFDVVPRPGEG